MTFGTTLVYNNIKYSIKFVTKIPLVFLCPVRNDGQMERPTRVVGK
jgi:hypothetical protein